MNSRVEQLFTFGLDGPTGSEKYNQPRILVAQERFHYFASPRESEFANPDSMTV